MAKGWKFAVVDRDGGETVCICDTYDEAMEEVARQDERVNQYRFGVDKVFVETPEPRLWPWIAAAIALLFFAAAVIAF